MLVNMYEHEWLPSDVSHVFFVQQKTTARWCDFCPLLGRCFSMLRQPSSPLNRIKSQYLNFLSRVTFVLGIWVKWALENFHFFYCGLENIKLFFNSKWNLFKFNIPVFLEVFNLILAPTSSVKKICIHNK